MWKIDFMKICEVLDLDAILRSISLPFEKHVVFIAESKHVRVKGSRGFNSSRVAGRSTRLQRADYPLGAFT